MHAHADAILIEPSTELRTEFLTMAEEFAAEGDECYRYALEDFHAFVRRLKEFAEGVNLQPGRVRETTLWLAQGRRVIGSGRIRHELTPELEYEGGHVGYDIRPSERRKGYGTLILALSLERARALALNRVLLTCDTDNIASARIIEKSGGRLSSQAVSRKNGKLISRYWIDL